MPKNPLTIRSILARAAIAPLVRPIRTAVGDIPAAPLVLIDVATEQGITGHAYVFAYTPLVLAPLQRLIANLAEILVGQPVAPADRIRQCVAKFRLLGRQGLLGMALSGLDLAMWDVLGRALDQPLARLLGAEPRPIKAYDSYGVVDPRVDRAAIETSVERGFRAIKIKIGDRDLESDAATVAAVRSIVGPDIALMVDYNQSLDVTEALRRIDRLARSDLHWVEEPVPAEDLDGHARVRARSPVPIQTGENWWFTSDMAKAIAVGASDYAMPDLMKIGGITGWMHAAGQAEAAGIPVSSHIFIEASAHALAATPTAHWLEHLDLAGAILANPAEVRDGCITPRGPGLGIEWNEAAVHTYAA